MDSAEGKAEMRRAAKVDRNQSEIVTALRDVGASVQPLHTIGQGCPDVLVGYRGMNFVLEIKDGKAPPSKRRQTHDEQDWFEEWKGEAMIVESVDDALRAIGVLL